MKSQWQCSKRSHAEFFEAGQREKHDGVCLHVRAPRPRAQGPVTRPRTRTRHTDRATPQPPPPAPDATPPTLHSGPTSSGDTPDRSTPTRHTDETEETDTTRSQTRRPERALRPTPRNLVAPRPLRSHRLAAVARSRPFAPPLTDRWRAPTDGRDCGAPRTDVPPSGSLTHTPHADSASARVAAHARTPREPDPRSARRAHTTALSDST